ncbi:MAG: methylated-DNA--[protein]-cysteine S-methyltransferase [Arenimonas sp.]
MPIFVDTLPSPIGLLALAADETGLQQIRFEQERHPVRIEAECLSAPERFVEVRAQLLAYFAGELTRFELPLNPQGTPFQLRVWQALREISYARTESYGELARRIGDLKATRAVGAANGHNPLPIVIPCHRVIGSDGSLTGFGGGIERKRFLLELEGGQPQAGLFDH